MNLDAITDIPGILSAFTFDENKGVTSHLLSEEHYGMDLDTVGRVCSQLWAMVGNQPVKNLRLAFDSIVVTATKTDPVTLLVTFSDTEAKEEELRVNLDKYLAALSQKKNKISQAEIDEQLQTGPVAGELEELSDALFPCVGPVAKVIFRDAVREWMGTGSPSKERLQDLIEILVREIRNPEKSREYLSGLSGNLTNQTTK